jgi:hypothetical protein
VSFALDVTLFQIIENFSTYFVLTQVMMVKTRKGTSTIDVASPLRTPRPHPQARLKANTTDKEESGEQLRRSTCFQAPLSDSEHDSNDDNETLNDNNGHAATPTAAQVLGTSLTRKVQTKNCLTDSKLASPSTFVSVTKRGPPRGLPKDGAVNIVSPGQRTMTSVPSMNDTSPLVVSVSNNVT